MYASSNRGEGEVPGGEHAFHPGSGETCRYHAQLYYAPAVSAEHSDNYTEEPERTEIEEKELNPVLQHRKSRLKAAFSMRILSKISRHMSARADSDPYETVMISRSSRG